MRALLTGPRRKMEVLPATSGALYHWKCDEAAGTLLDSNGTQTLTPIGTVTVVASALADAGGSPTNARSLPGGLSYALGTAHPGATDVTKIRTGNIAAQVTATISSLSTNHVLLALSTAFTGSTIYNTPFAARVTAAGAIEVVWENGTGVQQSVSTPAGVVVADATRIRTFGFRRWFSSSNLIVDFLLDGAFVHRGVSANVPTAGSSTSLRWCVGGTNRATLGSGFVGTLHDVRVLSDNDAGLEGPRSVDFFRWAAARALLRYDQPRLIELQQYNAFVRVLPYSPIMADIGLGPRLRQVERDDYPFFDLDAIDLTVASGFDLAGPIVQTATMSNDIDGEGMSGSFTCAREIYDRRYSPFFKTTSPTTRTADTRIFDLDRPVRFEIAIVGADIARGDVRPFEWQTAFEGFMSSVDFGDDIMSINCRDRIAALQNTFCRPLAANGYKEKVYGDDTTGVAMETVIQSIIDDHEPVAGYSAGRPLLYTPTSPSWNLRRRSIGFVPVDEATRSKPTQIGWSLRYRWDDDVKQFRLTLFEPERVAPPVVHTFEADEYLSIDDASINEETIRNVCEVLFSNRAGSTDTAGAFPRERYVASDAVSIAAVGERYCQITEDSAGQVDSLPEATALADSCVLDLAQPKAQLSLQLLAFPWAATDDYYQINARDHFEYPENFGVTTTQTTFGAQGVHSTTLGLRGRPAGRVDRWIDTMIALPGSVDFSPFLPVKDPVTVDTTAIDGGLHVKWTLPKNPLNRAWDGAEVHMTNAVGAWTPTEATRIAFARSDSLGIPTPAYGPLDVVQTKVIFRDANNNVSAPIAGTSRSPRASLHNSPIGEARRADTDGAWVLAGALYPLYFPTLSVNPHSAFVQGTGPGGTLFVAPWAGRYTHHVTIRLAKNAGAPSKSNAYRIIAVTGPTSGVSGVGLGGTILRQSCDSGWVLPGTTSSTAEIFEWSFTANLSAGEVLALQLHYVYDPAIYSRAYFDQVADPAGARSSWSAFFSGAGA